MLPWFDIVIILVLLISAFCGYRRGFFGALRGIIGTVVGLLVAWLTTPLALAWLEVTLGLKKYVVDFLRVLMPQDLQKLLVSINSAVTSLQELRNGILSLPLPEKVTQYLNQAMTESEPVWQEGMSVDTLLDTLLGSFADSIMSAIVFLLIAGIVAMLVKGFLGLFTGSGGWGVFGIVDGILGMVLSTTIVAAIVIIVIGAIYPMIVVSSMKEEVNLINSAILNSYSASWINEIYQLYILPWFM